ncbi:TPA: DUF3362 domain-containing protein [Escherichia coli]|nr:DUF3362 domain-containing protein [Escherichia coli]HDD9932702.1 DUF3362 domain-containing protein [Escherichia coli]
MSSISLIQPDRDLFSWPQYWAACFGPAPFLPMSREEMDQLGWDSCDIILVTGDAYVDHPSFGMAICGRMLEAQGFRVGIIAQPDWSSKDDFMRLGKPNLFFGVTAGNMDSMINRYTADRRLRHDDAYTPDNVAGKRPDRATLVYTQRCKEAWKDVPVILGGIEASLRRTAHYDYWSDTVRRSVLVDSKADMLMFGNGERPLVEVAHRLAMGEPISEIRDVRNTAIIVKEALWLKKHRFRLDQVQNFYPSPLANSTTMYYTGKNPLAKIGYKSEDVFVPKGDKQRRLHKALLRYHDPANWPLIRQALEAMGKKHLIGSRRDCLVPAPTIEEMREARRQNRNTRPALTKHTPMATQRQTPATAKKASSTQSRPVNAGAKKRPKAAVGR